MKQVEFTSYAELASIEWAILDRAHNLVGDVRKLRTSTDQRDLQHIGKLIENDIQNLQEMLRIAKEEARIVSQLQSMSSSTDLAEEAMSEAFHEAAHQRTKETET